MTSRPFKALKKQPGSLTPSLVCINMPLPDTIISTPSNRICNNLISIHRGKYVGGRDLKIVDGKRNYVKLSGSCQAWCQLTQPAWLTGKHLDKIPCQTATENLHSQGIRALCGEECQLPRLVREGTKMPSFSWQSSLGSPIQTLSACGLGAPGCLWPGHPQLCPSLCPPDLVLCLLSPFCRILKITVEK